MRAGFPGLGTGRMRALFPDRGELRIPDDEIEEEGEVGDGSTSQVF